MFGWLTRRKAVKLDMLHAQSRAPSVMAEQQAALAERLAMERERKHRMRVEQLTIQQELGFDPDDDAQGWLRLHQILKNHEDRLTALEKKNDRKRKSTAKGSTD